MKKCEFDDHTIIYTNTIKLPLESLGIYIFVRGLERVISGRGGRLQRY